MIVRVNVVLLLIVTDYSTTCAVVIFNVKLSFITSVDKSIKSPCCWSSVNKAVMLLAMKTKM